MDKTRVRLAKKGAESDLQIVKDEILKLLDIWGVKICFNDVDGIFLSKQHYEGVATLDLEDET